MITLGIDFCWPVAPNRRGLVSISYLVLKGGGGDVAITVLFYVVLFEFVTR